MKLGIVDMEANFVPGSGNQIGVKKDEWPNLSPIKRLIAVLEIISKSDFDYLELGIPWVNEKSFPISLEDIQTIIKKMDLKVGAYCSLMPTEIKTVGSNFNTKQIENYLKHTFSNCNTLGGNIIVFGSGTSRSIPPDYPKEKAVRDIVNFLALADNIIKENSYSFKIVIEPLNKNECNFINSLKEAYDIALKVDSTNIGITLDIFHAWRQQVSFWDELNEVISKVYHIHIAQPEDRKWPGHLNEKSSFDFNHFFSILKDLSYTGNVSVECNFSDLAKEIGSCCSFLRNYIR